MVCSPLPEIADLAVPEPAVPRSRLLQTLDEVAADATMHVDVFAPERLEAEVGHAILRLAKAGAVRIMIDDTCVPLGPGDPPIDAFEALFRRSARGGSAIRTGRFERYTADHVFVVSRNGSPVRVITGSSRLAVCDDPRIASAYARYFLAGWNRKALVSPEPAR